MIHVVLTGEVHVGKTTVCRAVVHLAQQRGYCVRGILTTPIFSETGQRLGFTLFNLATAEQRELARVDRDYGGPSVGPYHFDLVALQWGQDIIAQAIAAGCDLLVVDEIGRLELEQNTGFRHVLDLLSTSVAPQSPAQPLAGHRLLVVRKPLLQAFRLRLPDLKSVTFEATMDNRDTIAPEIVERLFPC